MEEGAHTKRPIPNNVLDYADNDTEISRLQLLNTELKEQLEDCHAQLEEKDALAEELEETVQKLQLDAAGDHAASSLGADAEECQRIVDLESKLADSTRVFEQQQESFASVRDDLVEIIAL